jgi:hypothetical protein
MLVCNTKWLCGADFSSSSQTRDELLKTSPSKSKGKLVS